MKKTILSSIIAVTIMLLGSTQSLLSVNATTQTTGQISNTKGIVTTNSIATIYALRDGTLTKVTNRALTSNSAWIFNKTATGSDGLTYYRVATNEWLPSNFIKANSSSNSNTSRTMKTIYIGTWNAATVNSNGSRTGNILPAHSAWQAFSDIVTINGQTYYQISSNEFVSTYDTASSANVGQNIDSNTTGTIVGNSSTNVYHMPGQRSYKINSNNLVYFKTEQEAINAGYTKSKV
ncbi:SLAP domain-containing protein [Companilactobacillus jidongensis]|uniref:SLAP domain-containing protein n=1 Tax=Companilactobacillus jidongensis TaxID=2486006 RepID=UPI000F7A6E98|nr:SLAP domain-containing protein [Companilactobacillus jidongensis]